MTDQGGIGDALRSARLAAGLSLRELAELTHFGKTYLGDIETGRATAPLKVIEAYARVRRDLDVRRRSLLSVLAVTPLGTPNDPATAETTLRYGLWLGDQGKLAEADTWYHVAVALADRAGDKQTQAYVRARIATRGHYEGWAPARVIDSVQEALALSNSDRVVVEANAAMVQIHTKSGDLASARAAAKNMLSASTTEADSIRTAVFINYLECMIGDPRKAARVYESFETELKANRTWFHEARVYLGMAHVRAGDRLGVSMGLEAVSGLPNDVHMIGVGVADLLQHVTWDSSEVDQLRSFARQA